MTVVTRWWWIRHAPVPDNGRIYGQSDLSCDCSERTVFAALAAALPAGAIWVTSHLRRTVETARAIHAADPDKFGGVEPTALPELAEQHLGDWQGLDRKAFYAERKVGTQAFWFAPADERPPRGESFADLVGRVAPAIERLTRDAQRPRHRRRDARRHHPRRARPRLEPRSPGRPRLRDGQLRVHPPRPSARRRRLRPVARGDGQPAPVAARGGGEHRCGSDGVRGSRWSLSPSRLFGANGERDRVRGSHRGRPISAEASSGCNASGAMVEVVSPRGQRPLLPLTPALSPRRRRRGEGGSPTTCPYSASTPTARPWAWPRPSAAARWRCCRASG